jgi:hypothetical protein
MTTRRLQPSHAIGRALAPLALAALALAPGGCASTPHRAQRPVPIDQRPTPPQPPAEPPAVRAAPAPAPEPAPRPATAPRAAGTAQGRFVADTLAAHAVLERCGQHRLLPDQEATVDSARRLLDSSRIAALGGDMPRAESLARQAHQLARSLNCP